MCRYLIKMMDFKIRFRIHEIVFINPRSIPQYCFSIHGHAKHLLSQDVPGILHKKAYSITVSRFVDFLILSGVHYPADMLNNHWCYNAVKDVLLPVLHRYGETDE